VGDDQRKPGSELFIVDNSDADWKVRNYLTEWCGLAKTIDIAAPSYSSYRSYLSPPRPSRSEILNLKSLAPFAPFNPSTLRPSVASSSAAADYPGKTGSSKVVCAGCETRLGSFRSYLLRSRAGEGEGVA
jgi:hypothetical protein